MLKNLFLSSVWHITGYSMEYTVQSPILLLIFNRPDKGARVFERIRQVQPARLYIAADAPRPDHTQDTLLCQQARAIIHQVDWDCEVHTRLLDEHRGCRIAVSDAITWFFDNEAEGIILEDDCLPAISFFYFCDTLLSIYRNNERIHTITGTNLQNGKQWGDASYYCSHYTNVWGWASWRRVWKTYDRDLRQYNVAHVPALLQTMYNDRLLTEDWTLNFQRLQAGAIDTWDHQLNFLTFFEQALCITPNVNLISNIGFGQQATHTHKADSHHADLPLGEITTIIHPDHLIPEPAADYYFLQKEHNLAERWRIYNKPKRRFKRWLKGWINRYLPLPLRSD